VPRGTAAHKAGFSPDDEILAIDGFRVKPDQWLQRMEQYRPCERVTILIARRERIMPLEAQLSRDRGNQYQLEPHPDAPPDRKKNLELWLKSI
jgi:predicted metalloprotease with PDZ domain